MIIKGLPEFATDKELFDFIVNNEQTIFTQAKSQIKRADAFHFNSEPLKELNTNKSTPEENQANLLSKAVLEVKTVINTTNILDSHKDVHIPGIWDKSLKETKSRMLHAQEHKTREFSKIISSGADLKSYTKNTTFKDLGYDLEGDTQALMFDSKVRKERNEYMHEQYAKGYVTNHSVGMIYVKMVTCINSEDYPVQKENYDKYAPMVANKEALKGTKYFWAVLEAKAIEGSAVPAGSNSFTPTTSIKSVEEKQEKQISEKELAFKKFLNIK
jgi:hypothetical protein